jgi:hypothetical protein
MTVTVNRPRGTRRHRTTRGTAAASGVYERPVGAALIGVVAIVVGAWGAVAGYIGPYFGFKPVATDTWDGNLPNGLLHLLPGAVAVAAGLLLLAMGPARRTIRGGAFMLPVLLLLASGAWFVIGPLAWPTFEHGNAFVVAVTSTRNLLNVACASYAPGLVLVMLGGMALKAGMVPPVAVGDPYPPVQADPAMGGTTYRGVQAAPVAAAGAGAGAAGAGGVALAEHEREGYRDRDLDRERTGGTVPVGEGRAMTDRPAAESPVTESPAAGRPAAAYGAPGETAPSASTTEPTLAGSDPATERTERAERVEPTAPPTERPAADPPTET